MANPIIHALWPAVLLSSAVPAVLLGQPATQPAAIASIEGPTGATHARPAWLKEGIVIAGNWATLNARKQQIRAIWTQDGFKLSDAEAAEAYRRELSPETADALKAKGVTLVVLPLFSGMGSYGSERAVMPDIKRFAEVLHARGMRVGVYIHQGMLSRGFLEARPDAYDWLAWPSLDRGYMKPPPPETKEEGYPVYRNHPEYQRFMREVIDYAVREVKADWLHFDNYVYTSGLSPWAIEDFRGYLCRKFTPDVLREHFGGEDLKYIGTRVVARTVPVRYEWQSFQEWMFAESYRKLADYARSLNPQVATDVNASGLIVEFRRPIDLSQLIAHGDGFWDEQAGFGWKAATQELNSAIASYKLARLYNQSALIITSKRLSTCESLAFNLNAQGCLYWFMYGRLNWAYGTTNTADDRLMPETRFFLDHRDLYAEGQTIADVAVLRGRAVNLYGPQEAAENAYLFEQAMITQHLPFELIFDQHLADLSKYRAVVLPDVRLMTDASIERLTRYVEAGGSLVITGRTAEQDEWCRPRERGLARLIPTATAPAGITVAARGRGRVVYVSVERSAKFTYGSLPQNGPELADALRRAMGDPPAVHGEAPPWIAMEYIRQPRRLLVHILDYSQAPLSQPVQVKCAAKAGKVVKATVLAPRQPPKVLGVRQQEDVAEVQVPGVDLYAVLMLDLE